MKHHFCLLFLPLCTVCLAAPSDDAADERRRLLDEGSNTAKAAGWTRSRHTGKWEKTTTTS